MKVLDVFNTLLAGDRKGMSNQGINLVLERSNVHEVQE